MQGDSTTSPNRVTSLADVLADPDRSGAEPSKEEKPQSWFRRAVVAAVLLAAGAATVALGAYYRFNRITEQGIAEGDTIGYYNIARKWAQGDRTDFWGDQFFRPVVYEINAMALRWFGDNDYSIKVMNGIFDMSSLVLIILIGRHLTGRALPGIAAGLIYALMPYAIQMCRSGMPHAISGFFVLLSLFLFRPLSRPQSAGPVRLLLDAGTGISLGLAANTHAELAFLGPGFVICQCIQLAPLGLRWSTLGRFLLRAAVLTLAFMIPYAIGIWIFGYDTFVRIFSSEVGNHSFTPAYINPAPLYRVPLDILTISSRIAFLNPFWIPLFMLLPPVAWYIRLLLRNDRTLLSAYTPWLLVAIYMIEFPFIIGAFDGSHVRIFLPLFPLFLVGAICAIVDLAGARTKFWAPASVILSTALVLYLAPNAAQADFFNNTRWYQTSTFRVAYDSAGKRVDANNRLLILPSTALYNRGYQLDFYFGTNAEYLADQERTAPYTPEFLHQITIDRKISYLLVGTWLDQGFFDPNYPSTLRGRPWFQNFQDVPYNAKDEMNLLQNYLAQYGAHPIATNRIGTFYSLRKRPLFLNSAFRRGTFEMWRETASAPLFRLVQNEGDRPAQGFHIDTRPAQTNGDDASASSATGTLESASFTIKEDIIGFAVAGAGQADSVQVALHVGGKELRKIPESNEFVRAEWDVSSFRGQAAQIVVRDLNPDPAAGIAVIGFYYVF